MAHRIEAAPSRGTRAHRPNHRTGAVVSQAAVQAFGLCQAGLPIELRYSYREPPKLQMQFNSFDPAHLGFPAKGFLLGHAGRQMLAQLGRRRGQHHPSSSSVRTSSGNRPWRSRTPPRATDPAIRQWRVAGRAAFRVVAPSDEWPAGCAPTGSAPSPGMRC
jgi:hypothetical protein